MYQQLTASKLLDLVVTVYTDFLDATNTEYNDVQKAHLICSICVPNFTLCMLFDTTHQICWLVLGKMAKGYSISGLL